MLPPLAFYIYSEVLYNPKLRGSGIIISKAALSWKLYSKTYSHKNLTQTTVTTHLKITDTSIQVVSYYLCLFASKEVLVCSIPGMGSNIAAPNYEVKWISSINFYAISLEPIDKVTILTAI